MSGALLITGCAGFIGSHLIRSYADQFPDRRIIGYDALSYAANLDYIQDLIDSERITFIQGRIEDKDSVNRCMNAHHITHIINVAAESHVDRSINDASPFIQSNICGVQVLLDAAKTHAVQRFLQVSTDEVYGSIKEGSFTENSPIQGNSPYAASKAAADLLVTAYHKTHGMNVGMTRCGNNYGPHQFPEKLIPLIIKKALKNENLPIYGDGRNQRDWIHVSDHCSGIMTVMEQGRAGEAYNIGQGHPIENLDIVHHILKLLDKPRSLIQFVTDRPGHDFRYSIDSTKLQNELAWTPNIDLAEGLEDTVNWYKSQFQATHEARPHQPH